MKEIKKNSLLDFNNFSIKLIYPLVIVIILLLLTFIKPSLLYITLIAIFLFVILCIAICINEIKSKKSRIEELSKSIDIVLKNSLEEINIPMVMVTNITKVIWKNNSAKHLLPDEYIIDTSMKLDSKLRQNESATVTLDLGNGKIYTAIANNIKFSNFKCSLITYIDKTEESALRETLENTKVSVGVIFIDNFDETMQGLDEITKAEITSKIETTIREWINESYGILTKVDKDKYIVCVEKQYIDKMEEESFKILEDIKKISNKTKLPITISIGFSYSELNLLERYSASSSALDIALGRGGDQAVVKKDKKFSFYGGSNIGLEKTNRVRARTVSQALKEIILKNDKVYIMGHKNSDIDCVGAAIGIAKMVKTLGKEVSIVIDSKYNSSTKYIIDKIKQSDEYKDVFINYNDVKKQDFTSSILVIVDTHKKSYLAYPEFLDDFEKVVIIDHHRRGPEFIENTILNYHEIYASSTAELVTELLMYIDDIELTATEAESLYAGIVVDTKNFMFKTGVRTFEVAAYLKKFGIDVTSVKQLFQNDFETYLTKVEIVKNAEIVQGKIAISTCEDEINDMPIVAAQAADELLSISGILASFVLCKVDNVIMVSGRSMGDINVQTILEKIGGGGHLTFAGAQLAGISIDEAKEKLKENIEEYLKNN